MFKTPASAVPIGDKAEIDARYRYWRRHILITLWLGYALFYFTRKSFNAAAPEILASGVMTRTDIGLLATLFYITYGLSKFVSGIVSDRSNARYFMGFGLIATGVVMDIINNDLVSMVMLSDAGGSNMFQVDAFKSMLEEMGVDESIVSFVITTANNVFDLSWRSGIQILLFLAGLQSIPGQLYEAASMDGCTAWERYWKVTFPLLGPVLIINLVYTIIDHFTSLDNAVMKSIMTYSKDLKYAYSSTLAWIYFACVIVILLVVALLARRRISYQEL